MSKHILFISQVFYPEVFRSNDLAAELVKRGYKVTVLTAIPNYPVGVYFDGYDKKHKLTEEWNGVKIIRLPAEARGNGSLQLIRNYHSFTALGKKWVKKNNIQADLVFTFETSPMSQALIGVWYGKKYNVPVFLYAQDLWPENIEAVTGIHNKLILGAIDKMVDAVYKGSDFILATSPSFVEDIVSRKKPVDRAKVHYWPQYAEEFYRMVPKPERSDIPALNNIIDSKDFKIVFTGNIGMAQGLDILPKTAGLLRDKNVKFVIVGDGRNKESFLDAIKKEQVEDMFVIIPRQPAERIPEILACCDAGFISFSNLELWQHTIPAKLQSYMACNKPIIASAAGETERIINESECGKCSQTGDPEALAENIIGFLNMSNEELYTELKRMGDNAKRYFEKHFLKEKLMDELENYFHNGDLTVGKEG